MDLQRDWRKPPRGYTTMDSLRVVTRFQQEIINNDHKGVEYVYKTL